MRGTIKSLMLGAGLAVLMVGHTLAADVAPVIGKAPPMAEPPPPPFNVEFGGWLASDYVFRGTTQSNGGPSVGAYATAVWMDTFYLGVAGAAIDWPSHDPFALSNPSAEIDFYGGFRFGQGPWSFDVGAIYYYYPKEVFFQSDFWEVYGIAKYAVNDQLTLGASINYSPDYLNYGMDGTTGALSFSWTAPESMMPPDIGFFVSGDVGHVWLGETTEFGLVPDYTYWSVGFGWTWKAFTLDLRYHDSDLSAFGCTAIWNAHGVGPIRNWCGERYVAKLSFGTTTNDLK